MFYPKKSTYQDCVVSYYASALKNQIHLQIQTAPNHLQKHCCSLVIQKHPKNIWKLCLAWFPDISKRKDSWQTWNMYFEHCIFASWLFTFCSKFAHYFSKCTKLDLIEHYEINHCNNKTNNFIGWT